MIQRVDIEALIGKGAMLHSMFDLLNFVFKQNHIYESTKNTKALTNVNGAS